MLTREHLARELHEKLRRLEDLRRHRPKKDCGHKEYSSAEDVRVVMEIEQLEDEVSRLRKQIEQQAGS